ncbi:hypothetical protein ACQCT5_09315 [Sutcliffiella halmapala]
MSDGRKEILTLNINQGGDEEGVLILSLFDNKEVGIAVSELNNGDAEIWLDLDNAKKVVKALNNGIKQIEEKKD